MQNCVRELRLAQDWTQSDLGERLDVTRQTVAAIENGKYDPALPLAFRIARIFNRFPHEVFDDGLGPLTSTQELQG